MKSRYAYLLAAFLCAANLAQADIQLNAGGIYAKAEEENSLGFELGAGFFFDHSTSGLSSALTLNYLGIGTIEEDGPSLDIEAGYDVFALNYKLYFPIIGDSLDLFVEGLAGAANTSVELSAADIELSTDEWGFAYGLGGGVQWNVTQNFGLNLGYTFLGLDETVDAGYALGDDSLHLLRMNLLLRF